ncbi:MULTISPECIES: pyridoxal-phosphate-dependent aminotransferase family protein [unclassified Helicobacter]|uniref:pyridoxal-phosphate-dependent aminotransferase family protein n=1 Tax=unclassified Helicobacter TaxID=2593540 RepID=UPI000CF05315|nr:MULTISPECIES: alanine--glyoxylate aminotransferase family protein [unclassified Helicobacter]
MKKNLLMMPGPTPVPNFLLKEIAKDPIPHRSTEFITLLKEVYENLKYVFQTQNDIFIYASSGTGAMCAALENILNPNDRILCLVMGSFSQRWVDIAKMRGAQVDIISCPLGKNINPTLLQEHLNKNAPYKVITLTHNETSTGAANNLQVLCPIIKESGALCVVDGISSICAMPCKMDELGIDILISGSQKGFMLPAGLSFLALSQKAFQMHQECIHPSFYFNFSLYKDALKTHSTPFTPSINLIFGLYYALQFIKQKKLETLHMEHKQRTLALRRSFRALGLDLVVPDDADAGYALTAIFPPKNIQANTLREILKNQYKILVADGQNELKNKIIRIGTLGYINNKNLIFFTQALENTLYQLGYKFKPNIGTKTLIKALGLEK